MITPEKLVELQKLNNSLFAWIAQQDGADSIDVLHALLDGTSRLIAMVQVPGKKAEILQNLSERIDIYTEAYRNIQPQGTC
jgi:hypothetical protein